MLNGEEAGRMKSNIKSMILFKYLGSFDNPKTHNNNNNDNAEDYSNNNSRNKNSTRTQQDKERYKTKAKHKFYKNLKCK